MAKARNTRATKESINYGYDSAFPSRLRELLEETTQDSLAAHCGVARQSVAQWKDGKTKPDIYYLEKIADFFEVSTDYLLCRTEIASGDVTDMEIHKRLGLSQEAINALNIINSLITFTEDTEDINLLHAKERILILNNLIASDYFYDITFHLIEYVVACRQCMIIRESLPDIGQNGDYYRINETLLYSFFRDYTNDSDLSLFRANKHFNSFAESLLVESELLNMQGQLEEDDFIPLRALIKSASEKNEREVNDNGKKKR